jgi:hypothetical protein
VPHSLEIKKYQVISGSITSLGAILVYVKNVSR